MTFPKYPEYKDSGVEWLGEVPAHWSLCRFKQVFQERAGRSQDGSGELLSVSAYWGVRPRSESREEGEHLTRADSLEGYKLCEAGDLVMNIMLAWNRGLGFAWQNGIVSPAYSVFAVIDGSEPRFLDYLVRSDECTRYFKAFSAGVIDSRLRLYPEVFGRLTCALPTYDEQAHIATFLDHETARIDALVEEQQRLIELLKEKRQAVISHAVTKGLDPDVPMKDSGVEWLGQVPEHWEVSRLKFLASVISKGTTPTTVGAEFVDDGIRFLKAENVGNGYVQSEPLFFIDEASDRLLARSRLQVGDVLVVIAGATTGRAAVVKEADVPSNTNQAVSFIRLNSLETASFVTHWIQSESVQRLIWLGSVQAAQPNLAMEDLGNIEIAVPPREELEILCGYIAKFESDFQSAITTAVELIDRLQERRSALISAAVTGKIDVRGWQPPAVPSATTEVTQTETV